MFFNIPLSSISVKAARMTVLLHSVHSWGWCNHNFQFSILNFQFVFLCISRLNRNSDLRSKLLRLGYTRKKTGFFLVYLKT